MKARRTVEEAFFKDIGGQKIRRSEPPLGKVAVFLLLTLGEPMPFGGTAPCALLPAPCSPQPQVSVGLP